MPAAGGPLKGLQVIDLTRALAGPFCTMLLADLGATVIKVESLGGDPMRGVGPFDPTDQLMAFGGYFQSINRNKSSLAVNLGDPQGVGVVRRLVTRADVVVENFRPGVMERLGLGFEDLHELNRGLVYGCIRGFGDPRTGRSPYADWPAYDVIAQAMGGIMGITGPDPETPTKVGPGVGDIFPAALLAVGILAAVRHAQATGTGQLVDVAMYDSVLALCERIVHQYSYVGEVPRPMGNANPIFSPFGVFRASDGLIAIAAPHDPQWRALCAAMSCPNLGNDERYATNGARVAHDREVREIVETWTSKHARAEITAILGGRVPCGPVQTIEDIVGDRHTASRAMLLPLEHPGVAEPRLVAADPIHFTLTRGDRARRAPLLGEQTAQIMNDIGYTPDEVESLCEAGAVAVWNSHAGDGTRRPGGPSAD